MAVRLFAVALLLAIAGAGLPNSANALQPIVIGPEQDRIEITRLGDFYEGRGDRLDVETAAGPDSVAGRMSVRAATAGTNPNWVVFALRNPTDKTIERWLTADRYNIVGSGLIWPDLDSRRIENLTPSVGFVPERVQNDRVDIFRITVEPGQTVTFVAELSSERMPNLYLWTALAFEQKQRDRSLFNGILIGIVGLLCVYLTAIFAANHSAIFPSAALVAWSVLAYLCIDFGFWHKLFHLKAAENGVYRATAEAAVAASIVIFLYAYLRVGAWSGFMRVLFGAWIAAQITVVSLAVIDPRLASMLARASLLAGALAASPMIAWLALRGQDRATTLVPTWLLYGVWLFGASVLINGRLSGDFVVAALLAGLVIIIVLLGFTVTQFAFRSHDPVYSGTPSELQMRSLAIDSAGAAVWEWNSRRDEISVSPNLELALGLSEGDLSRRVDEFLQFVHPQDRDRFKLMLWSAREKSGGPMHFEFQIRKADGGYRWLELEAASVPHGDHKHLKCAGLLRDITDVKRAQEQLTHDAVNDSLTGLPNRELFLDRLGIAMKQARLESRSAPLVICIGIDRFKGLNDGFGLMVGDSMLINISRRLARHVAETDTLARIGGDQFAILMANPKSGDQVMLDAERLRRALRSPITISGKEVMMTGSIGIAGFDGTQETQHDLLREAESAMYRAKQGGTDRIEVFKPEMRGGRDDRLTIASELRRAIERQQIQLHYQPIIRMPHEELAGFEALVRWHHPRLGLLNPDEFIPIAEDSDLISKLGNYVMERAIQDLARWQKELPRTENPLFVSVNVSSRQLFRQEMISGVRALVGRDLVERGTLHLEITESLVMENPEQAVLVLEWLRSCGVSLALDDFGTGYSSLAYLNRFAFDTIKLDKSLLQSSHGDGSHQTIVRSMVALVHELGKIVVAEGVETEEDASFLRSVSCDYVQGFLYSEPVEEAEVREFLKVLRKTERNLEGGWFGWRWSKSKDSKKIADSETDRPMAVEPPRKSPPGALPPHAAPRPAPAGAPSLPHAAPGPAPYPGSAGPQRLSSASAPVTQGGPAGLAPASPPQARQAGFNGPPGGDGQVRPAPNGGPADIPTTRPLNARPPQPGPGEQPPAGVQGAPTRRPSKAAN